MHSSNVRDVDWSFSALSKLKLEYLYPIHVIVKGVCLFVCIIIVRWFVHSLLLCSLQYQRRYLK